MTWADYEQQAVEAMRIIRAWHQRAWRLRAWAWLAGYHAVVVDDTTFLLPRRWFGPGKGETG
jgi:hypothetical protein